MMTRTKKILVGALVLLFAFIIKLPHTFAACSISISSVSNVVVGNTFKVTATVSSDVGSWYYVLGYDPSRVQLVSGNTKVVGVIGDSKTNTYTFKALKSGTATFSATNVSLASNSTNAQCQASAGRATVTMRTQAEIEASYSRNNNLSSLAVEGAELSPSFNKDVTEYTATLPVDTTKAKVLATTEDKTASVVGAGEIDVVDGLNKIEITVTAQHGEKKTYVINLTVEELDPINVTVNNKKYTIVRKSGQVENIPVGFVEDKMTIQGQDVTVYKSKVTKLTLVALKDEEGIIGLFIYDTSKKEFKEFKEVKTSGANLIILSDVKKDIPTDFEKTTFDYNEEKLNGYRFKEDNENRYFLVYAQNLETGNEGFYLYDSRERTFQKYYNNIVDFKNNKIKTREYIIIGFLAVFGLVILVNLIKLFSSKESKIKKYEKKLKKLKNKSLEDDYYDISKVSVKEEPVIKKVEDDEYVVPKKTRKQKLKEIEDAKKKLDKTKPTFRRVSLEDDDI